MKRLEDFLKPTQKELFALLRGMYKDHAVICKNSYILVRGSSPVMLLAHLDTVHTSPVREICVSQDGNVLMSPQGIGGDDRCGVYALVTVYERSKIKPWLLFTCDEETGGAGAYRFSDMHGKGKLPGEVDHMKMLLEIDRRGQNDAVYYNCENPEFEEYITSKGFQTAWGSFSDISLIAPELGVAAANLSSGYYNAHTLHEYINRKHLNEVVKKVTEIVAEAAEHDFPKYEYVDRFRSFGRRGRYGSWQSSVTEKKPETLARMAEGEFSDAVPEYVREDYETLLDYYTAGELEELRAEYGDRIIPMLCETELGFSYGYGRDKAEQDKTRKSRKTYTGKEDF